MKPEQLEIDRLRFHREAPSDLAAGMTVRRAVCFPLDLPRLAQPRPNARFRHDEVLVTVIDRSFKSSDRTYGARRVWHDVLAEGLCCGLHRFERLMLENE